MLIIGSIIMGILEGNILYSIIKNIVTKEEDRLKEFNLKKKYLILATAIIAVALYFKFSKFNLVRYSIVTAIIITIAIIDYYTHFVYFKIVIPSLIIVTFLTMYSYNLSYILQAIYIAAILFLVAYFTGKWYGDVELIFLITLSFGIKVAIFIISIACIVGVAILIVKKRYNTEIAFCPLLAIGYFFYIAAIIGG